MTMLDVALSWLARGVELVPCQPGSKYLVPGFGPRSRRITGAAEAQSWFGDRQANMALVTGGGLVVLDFDDKPTYAAAVDRWPGLGQTYTESTRRGFHVFVAGDSASGIVEGIEVKGSGSVIVSAPSVVAGVAYRVEVPGAIAQVPVNFPLLSESLFRLPPVRPVASVGGADVLARVKAGYSILELAEGLTRLTGGPRWFHGRCPFHDDGRASFWVDAERGLWGCYACNVKGDVINLWARSKGQTVRQAIKAMAAGLG